MNGSDDAPEAPALSRQLGDVPGLQRAIFLIGVALVIVGAGLTVGALFGGTQGVLGPFVAVVGAVLAFLQKLADVTVRTGLIILGVAIVVVPAVAIASVAWAPGSTIVLEGDLTIAFVPLSVSAPDDVEHEMGTQIAKGLHQAFSTEANNDSAISSLIIGSAVLDESPFGGVDLPADRQRAQVLAVGTNADFVVGGQVVVAPIGTTVTPWLFVSSVRVPDAPELAGWYAGAPVQKAADVTSDPNALAEVYSDLGGSLGALVSVGLALQELATGDASKARTRLRDIAEAESFGVVSKELTLLFLGNAEGAAACAGDGCVEEGLTRAVIAFEQARAAAPTSIRPRVGLAEVALLRAQHGCSSNDPPDETALRAAEMEFSRLAEQGKGVGAAKARLGLVRVQGCRVLAGTTSDDQVIRDASEALTAAAGNDAALVRIAAEAQSWHGLTARILGRPDDATRALTSAVELAERAGARQRRALWLTFLAEHLSAPPICDASGAAEQYKAAIEQYQFLIDEATDRSRERLEAELASTESASSDISSGC